MKKKLIIGLLFILSVTALFSMAKAKNGKNAWLGVTTQTVDDELADAFDLDITYGAIINEIIDDSPAEKANLSQGDIIIAYNSHKVYDYEDLLDYLEDSPPEEKISLTIMRDKKKMDIDVTLEKAPRNMKQRFYSNDKVMPHNGLQNLPSIPDLPDLPNIPNLDFLSNHKGANIYKYGYENSSYIGVQLTTLTNQLRTVFGVQDDMGVLVSEVDDDSPAEKAGIKAGDIIIQADKDEIFDYTDLKETIGDKKEGDIVSITVVRDKNKKQFDVTVAQHEDRDSYFFQAPDISFHIPRGNGRNTFFSDNSDGYFNSEEFKDEMKELKKELEHLKFELNNEMIEKFNSEEFKKEIKKLKKEFNDNESLTNKELKLEMKELKKELQDLEKRIDD